MNFVALPSNRSAAAWPARRSWLITSRRDQTNVQSLRNGNVSMRKLDYDMLELKTRVYARPCLHEVARSFAPDHLCRAPVLFVVQAAAVFEPRLPYTEDISLPNDCVFSRYSGLPEMISELCDPIRSPIECISRCSSQGRGAEQCLLHQCASIDFGFSVG